MKAMYSDFEPTNMDHLICGASSVAPFTYSTGTDHGFIAVINSNLEIHWSATFNYMEESVCLFRDASSVVNVASVLTPRQPSGAKPQEDISPNRITCFYKIV